MVTMGIALAPLAESMPQFALLLVLTLLPMQLVSGPATPRGKHAGLAAGRHANLSHASFRQLCQSVLSRTAGLDIVWPELLIMAIISVFYFAVSGVRFRRTLVVLQ